MGLLAKIFGKQLCDDEPIPDQVRDLDQWKKASPETIFEIGCDEIPGAYGDFGTSLTNPIPVNGPIGEVVYLNRLRSENGSGFFYHRIGSFNSPICPQLIDAFELVALDSTKWITLFFNMYYLMRSTKTPKGIRLAAWSTMDKAHQSVLKFCITGSRQFVEDFPNELPAFITSDTRLNSLSNGLGARMAQNVQGYLQKHEGQWKRPSQVATVLLATGRIAEAIEKFRQAIQFNPNDAYSHFFLGQAYEKTSQPEAAVAEYQRAVQLDPDNAAIHTALLKLSLDFGDAEAAINEATHLIRLNPNDADLHQTLGNLFQAVERNVEAAVCFFNVGNCYAHQNQYINAILAYRAAISLDSNNAYIHLNLGSALKATDDHEGAAIEYNEAIRIQSSLAEAYYGLGNIAYDEGRYEEAISKFQEAVRIRPDFTLAWYNQGVPFIMTGKMDDAIRVYRRAVALEPDHYPARLNLGMALSMTGNLQEAELELHHAITLAPDSAKAHYYMGEVLHKANRPSEATVAYRKSLDLAPNNASSHLNLGIVLLEIGDNKEAREEWQKAIQVGDVDTVRKAQSYLDAWH